MYDPYSYMSSFYGGMNPMWYGYGYGDPAIGAPQMNPEQMNWWNNRTAGPVEQMPKTTTEYDNPQAAPAPQPTDSSSPAAPAAPPTSASPPSPLANQRQMERFRFLQQGSGRKVTPLGGDLTQRQMTRANFLQNQGGRPALAAKPVGAGQPPPAAVAAAGGLAGKLFGGGAMTPRQQARADYLKKMGR